MVDISSWHAPEAAPGGGILVIPYAEAWLFRPDGTTPIENVAVDLTLDLLREGGHEARRGPLLEDQNQLLAKARLWGCDRMLAVGIGLMRAGIEPPSPDAGLHLFVALIDVMSGQALMTVVADTAEAISLETAPELLPLMIECVLQKVLDRSDLYRSATNIDGMTLAVLEPPAVIREAEVSLPKAARRKRFEGVVVLEFVVDENGRVTDLHVVESVPELDKAFIKAVKRSRYTPGRRGGRASPFYMTARFKLTRD
jgi:TonB family protein